MKNLATTILIFCSFSVYPCGWGYDLDAYFFYNLFEQTNFNAKSYTPFLRDGSSQFYSGKDGQLELDDKSGNVKLWKELLQDWSTEDIKTALYSDQESDFNNIWNSKKSSSARQYMAFARRCSNLFEFRYSWNYEEILNSKIEDIDQLLNTAKSLVANESNKQLQLRYGYQIIRILHYSNRFQEAINYFDQNIKDKFEKNELYYYVYDQVAGCYYSNGDFEKAAYMFMQVFDLSLDRKASAFLSYNFCVNNGAEGRGYFSGTNDQATYITLKALRPFSDDIAGLIELQRIAPNNGKVELLFARALNNIEREIWPTYNGIQDDILPKVEEEEYESIQELKSVVGEMLIKATPRKKGFWQLADSYLSFLDGDIAGAQSKLDAIKGNRKIQKQKNNLAHVYKVFSWDAIDEEKEDYLAPILDGIIDHSIGDGVNPAWKYLILDQLGHLYYKNNQLGKAFLCHNTDDVLLDLANLDLIDSIIEFENKTNKNSLEKLLSKKRNFDSSYSISDYYKYVKGHYYLLKGDPESALPYLEDNSLNEMGYGISQPVSAWVFSNNIKECFSCSTNEVMEDSVFLAGVYSFIEPEFNRADLARNLLQLEEMTTDEKQWKRKLAHYLLGNYYYNVSTSGYFRGTLFGEDNCCDYNFFTYGRRETRADEYIENRQGYNLNNAHGVARRNFDLADIAYDHYQQVLDNSTDRELNARCLYMMAKCELNNMYQKYSYWDYIGEVTEQERPYKQSFEMLAQEYQDTKFYDKILEECSFFRMYTYY